MKKLRILIYDTMRFFHSDIETLTEIEIFDLKQQLLILEVEEGREYRRKASIVNHQKFINLIFAVFGCQNFVKFSTPTKELLGLFFKTPLTQVRIILRYTRGDFPSRP